jgi:hypothetical protein
MHQGYPTETLVRFLKARDWNVAKAHKMVRSIYFTSSLLSCFISKFYILLLVRFIFAASAFTDHSNLFQLVDFLQWRIQNEIDQILEVSYIVMVLLAKNEILWPKALTEISLFDACTSSFFLSFLFCYFYFYFFYEFLHLINTLFLFLHQS